MPSRLRATSRLRTAHARAALLFFLTARAVLVLALASGALAACSDDAPPPELPKTKRREVAAASSPLTLFNDAFAVAWDGTGGSGKWSETIGTAWVLASPVHRAMAATG